ncbi:MAG: hypothetical protein V1775_06185 [Bacteroidota bacterium]
MTFNNLEEIREAGFTGFKKISELYRDDSVLPAIKGVYLVLYLEKRFPEFLSIGTGGFFKGKDPNVSLTFLENNWVKDTIVVYIGKAGKEGSSATLKSRLKQYLGFGKGGNVGHYGGRLIWQLKNSHDLVVCWKTLPKEDPRSVESSLIRDFYSKFSQRPFANLLTNQIDI